MSRRKPRPCRCAHHLTDHEHHHDRTYCSQRPCRCRSYRPIRWWHKRTALFRYFWAWGCTAIESEYHALLDELEDQP